MEKGWIRVYTTIQMFRAEIFKRVLADHDIEAVIINKMDSSYKTFGEIEVYVKNDHVIKAKLLAKEFDT
ncbi:MAG: hypothetical protein AMS23_03940 [Bacteroides sp. SM1_62]|jgi:hypothetical protein|nr:MAG: hypothetical protein AMS26_08075 [Bacteroides sp. SM23_62]KPL25942.1 MAG: hypothetical protein AMS23_03940 [Bacteroides sp. SM1_62]